MHAALAAQKGCLCMVNFKVGYFGRTFVGLLAFALLLTSFASSGLAAAAAFPVSGATPYIIGGHAASESYPGMASLQVDFPEEPDFHICGATLVSRRYAVTNAHCVTDFYGSALDPSLFHLRIGSPSRLEGGVSVDVNAVLPHADWNWGLGNGPVSDIALLRLADYVQLQPFEIAPHLAARDATTRLLGWGVTEPDGEGPLPINLQEIDTKLTQPSQCADGGITAGEICVRNVNGTDGSCYGDSGGPALQKVGSNRWSAVGGTSRSGADWCGTGNVIYTDLTYFRSWIYQVMRTGIVPPPTTTTGAKSVSNPTHYNWAMPAQASPQRLSSLAKKF
jgi:secreted trypsin-like serine protease